MDDHVTQARQDAYADAARQDASSSDANTYAVSGEILLTAVAILFFVLIILFIFHFYARWYLLRARRRYLRSRRANIVFHVDAAAAGLDARVLDSLPVFTYSAKTHTDSVPECAVCLSEFEENESGRILPKCEHRFHIDCIDMWFHSHSTCPLCRTTVEGHDPGNFGDVELRMPDPFLNGSAVPESFENRDPVGTSSAASPRKLSIDLPMRRGQNFEGDPSGLDSGTFRSPMSRMLSFRRMASRERRQTPLPSPRNSGPDLERGAEENRLTQ